MAIRIESISPSEVEALHEAAVALHHHEVAVQPRLGGAAARDDADYWSLYSERFAEWFAHGHGFCFAARDDSGRVIGFVFCTEREGLAAYDTGEKIGYVEEIAVLESARKSGVGRDLMDAARSVFRERGYIHFELSTVPGNDSAREFYTKLGLAPAAQLMIGDV